VQGHDHPWLLSHTLAADQVCWVSGHAPAETQLTAKTRYRQQDMNCQHRTLADDRFNLQFEKAQWAVTPGQSAVLYDGDVCLGGGIIDTGSTITN
jgi:tRNA-specific 2-thiouridylase